PMPSFLHAKGSVARKVEKRLERRDVPFGSMLSITGSFEHNGRRFLQSADGTVVPRDRMRLFKRSTFEGLELGTETRPGHRLPLAWPRKATHHYSLSKTLECDPAVSKLEKKQGQANEQPGRLNARVRKLSKTCLVPMDKVGAPREAIQLTGRVIEIAGTR